MALKISMENPFSNAAATEAYIKLLQYPVDSLRNQGQLQLMIWENEAARVAVKKPIAMGVFEVGAAERLNGDGCIEAFHFSDIRGKTEGDVYTKLKTCKIKVLHSTSILDLSTAADV